MTQQISVKIPTELRCASHACICDQRKHLNVDISLEEKLEDLFHNCGFQQDRYDHQSLTWRWSSSLPRYSTFFPLIILGISTFSLNGVNERAEDRLSEGEKM